MTHPCEQNFLLTLIYNRYNSVRDTNSRAKQYHVETKTKILLPETAKNSILLDNSLLSPRHSHRRYTDRDVAYVLVRMAQAYNGFGV